MGKFVNIITNHQMTSNNTNENKNTNDKSLIVIQVNQKNEPENQQKITNCHSHDENCGHKKGHCQTFRQVEFVRSCTDLCDSKDIDPTILVKDNITRRHQVLLEEQKNKPFYKGSMNIRFIAMLILIGSYFLVEIIFGAMTESLTMIADAMHMLTDFIALLIGFYSALMANKKRTNKATFGMARMEVIGGVGNGCFFMAIALNIFLEAVTKLIKKELNETLISNSLNLMIVGGVGLLINLIGMLIFGSHGHGHSHGHKENDGDFHSRKTKNFNMHAVFLHVMGDTLGSVAVIVSSLVIRYTNWPNRTIIDPICSLVISVIIFLTSIPVVKGATSILLEKVPANIDLNTLKQQLVAIKG